MKLEQKRGASGTQTQTLPRRNTAASWLSVSAPGPGGVSQHFVRVETKAGPVQMAQQKLENSL